MKQNNLNTILNMVQENIDLRREVLDLTSELKILKTANKVLSNEVNQLKEPDKNIESKTYTKKDLNEIGVSVCSPVEYNKDGGLVKFPKEKNSLNKPHEEDYPLTRVEAMNYLVGGKGRSVRHETFLAQSFSDSYANVRDHYLDSKYETGWKEIHPTKDEHND